MYEKSTYCLVNFWHSVYKVGRFFISKVLIPKFGSFKVDKEVILMGFWMEVEYDNHIADKKNKKERREEGRRRLRRHDINPLLVFPERQLHLFFIIGLRTQPLMK